MAIEQTPELDQILQEAADRNASDVFLIPGEPVSFRIAGTIERKEEDPLTAPDVLAIARAAVGEEAIAAMGENIVVRRFVRFQVG